MWPRIGPKENTKLRDFGDFLQSCNVAMPHMKGLEILNDCEENQKLLSKLPDWLTSRWKRYATEQLDQTGNYPGFCEFSTFICKEARIVCNPMSSVLTVRYSEGKPSEIKHPMADTFTTSIATTNGRVGPEQPPNPNFRCTCFGESHSLHKRQRLAEKSAKEKKEFVLVNKLCFACFRKGHYSKDCEKKATCSLCKGKHPNPLHQNPPLTTDPSVQGELQSEGVRSHAPWMKVVMRALLW